MSDRKLYQILCDETGCGAAISAEMAPSVLRRKITGKNYKPRPWGTERITPEPTPTQLKYDIPPTEQIRDYCPNHVR